MSSHKKYRVVVEMDIFAVHDHKEADLLRDLRNVFHNRELERVTEGTLEFSQDIGDTVRSIKVFRVRPGGLWEILTEIT